ncbi:MAG: hypothetical protein JXA99_12600 [Candidatus Lokiarchaeota archaeon]|nr:hypothetical protein [Candidatus Lokiarchaeota archaeon]
MSLDFFELDKKDKYRFRILLYFLALIIIYLILFIIALIPLLKYPELEIGINQTRDLLYEIVNICGIFLLFKFLWLFLCFFSVDSDKIIKHNIRDKDAVKFFNENIKILKLQYINLKKIIFLFSYKKNRNEYHKKKIEQLREIQNDFLRLINENNMKYNLKFGDIIFKENPITENQQRIFNLVIAARTIYYNRKAFSQTILVIASHIIDLGFSFVLFSVSLSLNSIILFIVVSVVNIIAIFWWMLIIKQNLRLKEHAYVIMGGIIDRMKVL